MSVDQQVRENDLTGLETECGQEHPTESEKGLLPWLRRAFLLEILFAGLMLYLFLQP